MFSILQCFMLRCNIPLLSSLRGVTVGSVIIGDEILKGYIQETNSTYLAKKLFTVGCKLEQIAILPDDGKVISECVRDFSKKFDIVVTSGGIGPTHDDITFESIALAFEEDCFVHPDLYNLVKQFFGAIKPASPHMKLCTVPKSTKLIYEGANGKTFKYPVVCVNNVYILPGIPQLFERTISNLVGLWAPRNRDRYKKYLFFLFNLVN